MKARLEANGVEVVGVTDHGFVKSIYFFDPNGIRLEFTAETATQDEIEGICPHRACGARGVDQGKGRGAGEGLTSFARPVKRRGALRAARGSHDKRRVGPRPGRHQLRGSEADGGDLWLRRQPGTDRARRGSGSCRATGRPTPCSCSCIRRRPCICCRCRPRSPMRACTCCAPAAATPRTTAPLIMEKVAYDLGAVHPACARGARLRKVVLVGWSGGGSLSLFYQGQAEQPTITHTPAGDPYDLTAAESLARRRHHLHRGASEPRRDPDRVDRPVGARRAAIRTSATSRSTSTIRNARTSRRSRADFVAAFRAAQRARNAKITDWALDTLDVLKRRNDGEMERAFVVHRTMSDVRWIDAEHRSERAQAELVLPRRSAHRQLGARRAWRAIRRCARGCRNGPTRSRTPRGR